MPKIRNLHLWLVILAIYVVIAILISLRILNPYWQQIIQFAFIITISALGLNLIYGYTGQFSLGHAAFYGLGAYTSALFTKCFPQLGIFSFILGFLCAIMVVGLVAFLIGLPILRLKSDYLGIATLGFGIIVKVVFDNADAVIPVMGGSRGMLGIPKFTVFPLTFFLMVGAIIVIRNFVYSNPGRACISIREDDIAAESVGIDTTKYKTLGFVIGCIFAGVAGVLYAHLYSFLHPANFDFLKSFLLEGLRVILPPQILDWRLVIYPLLLIIVMIIKPKGLGGGMEFKFLRPQNGTHT